MAVTVQAYPGTLYLADTHSATVFVESFKQYVLSGNQFWAFGRDVPYHRPPSVLSWGLRHVHLLTRSEYTHYEELNSPLMARTSDKHLVYASNPFDPNHYLLLAIINPNAHALAAKEATMRTFMDMCGEFWGLN